MRLNISKDVSIQVAGFRILLLQIQVGKIVGTSIRWDIIGCFYPSNIPFGVDTGVRQHKVSGAAWIVSLSINCLEDQTRLLNLKICCDVDGWYTMVAECHCSRVKRWSNSHHYFPKKEINLSKYPWEQRRFFLKKKATFILIKPIKCCVTVTMKKIYILCDTKSHTYSPNFLPHELALNEPEWMLRNPPLLAEKAKIHQVHLPSLQPHHKSHTTHSMILRRCSSSRKR